MTGAMERLSALVTKELLSYLRDPRMRLILLGPPLMQLLIFSFAITLEVKNVNMAILNLDGGVYSQEFLQRVAASSFVNRMIDVQSSDELAMRINNKQVLLGLSIPADFSRELSAGNSANLQIILDGRRANSAQVTSAYLESISKAFNSEANTLYSSPTVELRHWFNPNLIYRWFIVPSLSGVLALLISILVTSLSIARERELGTFDQLLVSPVSFTEIIIGKSVPALFIGAVLGFVMILAGVFVFRVPFTGSILMLSLVLLVFILSGVGIGLSVSAVSQTQQQAILGAFTVIIPIVLTSGFATPVENMPYWLQLASTVNPLRWYLVVVQGSFLKSLAISDVLSNLLPLVGIAVVSLTAAVMLVRSRLQ